MSLNWKRVPLGGVIKNEDYFYDRNYDVREIVKLLENGGDVAVIGENGIGKSSILWRIYKDAEAGKILKNWEVKYIDLQGIDKKKTLIQHMLNELNVPFDKSADYEELKNMFDNAIKEKKVVLILDEFDKVRDLPKVFDKNFRDWLRSLSQSREFDLLISMREAPVKVFSKEAGFTSPFYNIFQVQKIEPFELETVKMYVQIFGINPKTGEEIYNLTNGHPRKVNFAIHAFWKWKSDSKIQGKFESWEKYYRYLMTIYEAPKPSLVKKVLSPVGTFFSRLSLFLIGFLVTAMISDEQLYALTLKVFNLQSTLSSIHFYLFVAVLILLSSAVGYLTAYLGLAGIIRLLLMVK